MTKDERIAEAIKNINGLGGFVKVLTIQQIEENRFEKLDEIMKNIEELSTAEKVYIYKLLEEITEREVDHEINKKRGSMATDDEADSKGNI